MGKDNSRATHKASRPTAQDATSTFEKSVSPRGVKRAEYILRLYVTGSSSRSLRAIYNLKKLCEEYLSDNYDLEIIDIYEHPDTAREEQIIAAPTLVKQLPIPLRKLVGDLSNVEKVLAGLDIYKRQEPQDA
jgi:circadian clock protein KaiB